MVDLRDICLGNIGRMNPMEWTLKQAWFGMDRRIYGAAWTGGSSPVLTRTDSAVGMVANVGVDSQIVTNHFDTAPIYRKIRRVTDLFGNVFIRIPRFYIKKGGTAPARTWQISEYPHDGFYLPWCFWNFSKNRSNDYIDIGAYDVSLSTDTTKLESKTGTTPLVSRHIVDFRSLAEAVGLGYQLLDIHAMDVLTVLATVEFATLDIQTVMRGFTEGSYVATTTATVAETAVNRIILSNANAALFVVGQRIDIGTTLSGRQIAMDREILSITTYDASNKALNFDGTAVNVAIGNIAYSVGYKNGKTDSVVASSGSITSNTDGKYPLKYRGVENVFGNIWQWVDGININEHQAWICRDANDYASNVFAAPYRQLGYVNRSVDGYSTVMGKDINNPEAELPVDVGGATTTYYADYYYQGTGQIVARVGGRWVNSQDAGLRYWFLRSLSSSADLAVGSRLLRKPL